MKASETKLIRIIEGTNQYLVPHFQRPYTWQRKNWDTLWPNIETQLVGEALPEASREHFMGAIVTAPAHSVPEGVTKYLSGVNYGKRGAVRGTFLESHFRWQIRTFWFAFLWVAAAFFLFVTIVGIAFAWLIVAITGVWVLYRIARGWLALNDGREIQS
jgi:hypothetical protein